MTTSALLSALPFSMDATDAPEPRDVIWPNVFVSARSVARRHVVVTILLTVLVLSWTTVITFCSNAVWIVDLLGFDPQGFVASAAVSILPSALLLTIMCVLPPIFEAVAKFYERRKSYTEVDLSVARRYFTFQFVNVYVSILSTALLADLQAAWQNPYTLVVKIGSQTPTASLYFVKLLILTCGTAPVALLRLWPLISRGPRYWTVEPPELPAVFYGEVLPRLTMTFTVFSTFWVFAPLVSVVALFYFAIVTFVYRYLLLYCHMPNYESGGQFFYLVQDRVLFGIGMSNSILFFWLLTRSLVGYALLVAPLPCVVLSFKLFSEDAYEKPSARVSLDAGSEKGDFF